MSLWRQTKEQPDQLANAPDVPLQAQHLWGYFVDLRNATNTEATERLAAQAVVDWCWMTGARLPLWERKAIFATDAAWVTEARRGR